MDFSQFGSILAQSGLDKSLYAVAPVLALIVRFGRAYWRTMDDAHTLLAALILGLVGAFLGLTIEHHVWQSIVIQGFTLAVVVMVAERVLRALAEKVPWLPKDNEYVRPEKPTVSVVNESGSKPDITINPPKEGS